MAITFLTAVAAAANTVDVEATIPATGVPAGSVAVAVWSGGSTTAVLTVPSGWSQVGSTVATNSQATALLIKVLTVGDLGSAVVFDSTAPGKNSVVIAFFSGVDTVTPLGGAPALVGYGSTVGTVITPASATRLSPAYSYTGMAIEFAASKGTTPGDWTPPSGFTPYISEPGSGSGALTLAIAGSSTQLSGENTWTLAAEWPQASLGGLWLNEGAAPEPEPGSVVHLWTGAPTHESAQVNVKTTGATSVRLAVSTSPAMTSPTYVAAQVPDAYGYVRFNVTGLTASTRYYVQAADTPAGGSEELIGAVGTIKTLQTPGSPFGTRKVVIGGCLATNAAVTDGLDSAAAWDADWGHFNGDFFYNGNSVDTEANWVGRYDSQIAGVGASLRAFVAGGHAAYELVSDHDTTNVDNGDSNTAWAASELAGWRKAVPHLPGSGDATTRDQQWDDGRVSFFMIDCRSANRSSGSMADGPTKTMLGAAQKARLLSWLDTNTAPFKVIISDAPWMGNADIVAKPDAWWSYATERQEVADAIAEQSAHVEVWHGDSHLIGYATAEKNTWGGFPVICMAPYYQTGGGRNTSTFSEYYNNSSELTAQYGRVTFTDDGNSITRTFVGWDALNDMARMTFETSVSTVSSGGSTIAATSTIGGTGSKVTGGGAATAATSDATGAGAKVSSGGTTEAAATTAGGDGTKHSSSGSEVAATASVSGAGQPVTPGSGGSVITATAGAGGTGSKVAEAGSSANATAVTFGAGRVVSTRRGGSTIVATAAMLAIGIKRALGGDTIAATATATVPSGQRDITVMSITSTQRAVTTTETERTITITEVP